VKIILSIHLDSSIIGQNILTFRFPDPEEKIKILLAKNPGG
jgi:hypothetical protein